MSAHAKLSASGSARWLTCPGSVQAEEKYPDETSSFAQEGTAAHALAEYCLTDPSLSPQEFIGKAVEGVEVDAEMAEYIAGYIAYVLDVGGHQMYEVTVDYGHIAPEGFGTSDVIAIVDDTLHVIDLKYGKGVIVDAEENTQGMLYALGALNDYGHLYDIERVVIHIYQPRANNFSTWTVDADSLERWGEWAAMRADEALSGNGERVASEKGCQWCKAKADCTTLQKHVEDIIGAEFDNLDALEAPDSLPLEDVGRIMEGAEIVTAWFSAIKDRAKSEIAAGNKVPGWKMVEGRSNRDWRDAEAAEKKLKRLVGATKAFEKKLLSVAKAEKLLGKKDAAKIADLIVKPPGAPTLAKESDKRPSIDDVADAFDDCSED